VTVAAGAARGVATVVWPLSRGMDRLGLIVHRFARPIRDGLILVGVIRALYYWFVQGIQPWTFWGIDARAYWGIDLSHAYSGVVGEHSSYLYSPVFAQLMAPLSLLPYDVYLVLWTALLAGVALWLARPWPWALAMLVLPVTYEILVGNIHLLIAAAIVVGFRLPWVYAYPVWAKLTPAVGIGWWFVRAQWRPFLISTLTIVVLGLVSVALAPQAWADWIGVLRASAGSNDFLVPRAIVGVLLVIFGALTGRRWMVPVAVWISLPVIWINSWAILLAVVRLHERVEPAAWLPRPVPGTSLGRPPVPVTGRTTAP
jgi:Glycosyltransferase family 87